jgi:hypothetical protein
MADVSCVSVSLSSGPELHVLVLLVSSVSPDRWSRFHFVGDFVGGDAPPSTPGTGSHVCTAHRWSPQTWPARRVFRLCLRGPHRVTRTHLTGGGSAYPRVVVDLFSDREKGPRARTESEVSETVWRGIEAAIQRRVSDGSFGYRYPTQCLDGCGPYGCDERSFWAALRANVPDLSPVLGVSITPLTPRWSWMRSSSATG